MGTLLKKARVLGLGAVAMAAGFAMQPAAAQIEVSNTGSGSAAVVPYYTVRDGWRTLYNITNTTGNTLAVKFRLHEGRNSRDVLDFNIVLSPYDVWSGFLVADANGRPFLQTSDRSCTSPLSVRDDGLAANEIAYSDFESDVDGTFRDHDATNGSIERMQEGYAVITVMGEDSRPVGSSVTGADAVTSSTAASRPAGATTAYYAKHVNGEPRNCAIVDGDFTARATAPDGSGGTVGPGAIPIGFLNGTNDIPGVDGSGNPIARFGAPYVNSNGATVTSEFGFLPIESGNAIKVNATLRKDDEGIGAGVESLHVANFGVGAPNLMTAQNFPYFLEPTLASNAGLWTTTALADLEAGIAATAVFNEWTNVENPGVTATGEWVVNMPTKRFHVDEDALNIQAACNVYRNLDVATSGQAAGTAGPAHAGSWDTSSFPAPATLNAATNGCGLAPFNVAFQAGNNGISPVGLEFDIYDREERVANLVQDVGTTPSPAPPAPAPEFAALNFETNVIRIARDAATANTTLNSGRVVPVDVGMAGLGGSDRSGWAKLRFDAPEGIPVTGLLFKKRDFGRPEENIGQSTEHGFDRPLP